MNDLMQEMLFPLDLDATLRAPLTPGLSRKEGQRVGFHGSIFKVTYEKIRYDCLS